MKPDLETYWKDLKHPPTGCSRCGKEFNEDDGGSKVTWRCQVCSHLVCRDCTLTLPGHRTPPPAAERWPMCSWAIVGQRITPKSERALEFWARNYASEADFHGRVKKIEGDIINVTMYGSNGRAVGSVNLGKKEFLAGEWSEDDWEPLTWSNLPGPGGREYYALTLCSVACWEAAGRPDE